MLYYYNRLHGGVAATSEVYSPTFSQARVFPSVRVLYYMTNIPIFVMFNVSDVV